MISSNDFRTGVTVELDGSVWRVVEFLHVKPGKGSAFVRTKLKNVQTGKTHLALHQAILQGTFIYQSATRSIDQDHALLAYSLQFRCPEDLLAPTGMNRDDFGLGLGESPKTRAAMDPTADILFQRCPLGRL